MAKKPDKTDKVIKDLIKQSEGKKINPKTGTRPKSK